MTDEEKTAEQERGHAEAAVEPETDWKSKYEQAVAQSRKWEERSKANADKAKEYDALAQSQADARAEADEARSRADEAEEKLAEMAAKYERSEIVAKVSEETGVPASLLHGADADEIERNAREIAEFAHSVKPGYPLDKGGAAKQKPVSMDAVDSIKDPVERVMARAKNIELYK